MTFDVGPFTMHIGVIGGGQLGRMLALAGIPLGLRFRCLDPAPGAPMAAVAEHVAGAFDDERALASFVAGLDAATYEFENVPARAAEFVAARAPLFPSPLALHVSQDRVTEKTFFRQLHVETPDFVAVHTPADLADALDHIGLPAVLKTRRLGYDGKGQWTMRGAADVASAVADMLDAPHASGYVLERYIGFRREFSIVAARGRDGATAVYAPIENVHRHGILRVSRTLADSSRATDQARAAAERMLSALDYVGVLAVEFFDAGDRMLANEMAPRVHNSGHWTIEGAETSQFENHVRAVCGLPLGSAATRGSAAMVNLIGELPDIGALLRVPGAHVHLYGKAARPGRKLGHVTVTGADDAERDARLALILGAASGDARPDDR